MGAFEGLAGTYEASRHGYPAELQAHLVEIGALTGRSLVVDLGAGTGQLVRLVAPIAAQVMAVEPEADMLELGRRVTADLPNVTWIQGRDADLGRHVAPAGIDLVVIGNAFHHMNQRQLIADLDLLLGPDGWLCVAASSVPVWLQDSDWSRALRTALEVELGPLDGSGVPDIGATARLLADSAFSDVSIWSRGRPGYRPCEQVLGEIMSSASGRLSGAALERFRAVIEPFADDGALAETVRTTAVTASRPNRTPHTVPED